MVKLKPRSWIRTDLLLVGFITFCQLCTAQEQIPNPFDLLPTTRQQTPLAQEPDQPRVEAGSSELEFNVPADVLGSSPAVDNSVDTTRPNMPSAELPDGFAEAPAATVGDASSLDSANSDSANSDSANSDSANSDPGNSDPGNSGSVNSGSVADGDDANAGQASPAGPAREEGLAEPQPGQAKPDPKQAPGPVDNVLTQQFDKAMIIDLQGGIFGKFHWYLNHRLDMAQKQDVDLIIMRLTTPGGDAEASLQLARRLRDLDWATTIIFIPEEAISGGAIISFGADRIYMQTGALIGDAGPIRLGMRGFEHAEEKVVSYLAEAVRELAVSKGRPGAIAEAMVDRKLVVLEATEIANGKTTFVTQEQVDANPAMYQVIGPVPETQQDRFLTVTASRAEELLLCEGVFASEQDLLAALTIGNLTQTELNWVDSTVYWLNRPWLTALLLIIGLVGLYFELAAPGISVAGLTAVVCFAVFFWSHALGGTAGWLEVLLFLVGVTCMICELFLLPGFGVFGISGIALLVLSLVMASQDFVVPDSPQQWSQLRSNLLIVVGSVLGVMVLFIAQVLLLDTIPGLNRFRLAAPEGEPVAAVGAVEINRLVHKEAAFTSRNQVGELGVAESDLRPSGKVMIDGGLLDVVTEGDYVSAGTPVEIIKIEGNRVIVRRR